MSHLLRGQNLPCNPETPCRSGHSQNAIGPPAFCVREVLHKPSEAQPTWCWGEAGLIFTQSVCCIANCFTLVSKKGEQALVLILD